MKKIKQPIITIILILFSFYYTNKAVEIIREVDPIMKEIRSTSDKYKIESKNAQVIGEKIIPGKNGKEIDYEESYNIRSYRNYACHRSNCNRHLWSFGRKY